MIVYNVTVNVDDDIHDEWLDWMKNIHIPEVMKAGGFIANRIAKVMVEEEAGTTYSIQYTAKNMHDLEEYQKNHAPALQAEHTNRYKGKFVAFRTLLKVVHEH